MQPLSQEILANYEIRKSRKQKQQFIEYIRPQLEAVGYSVSVEKRRSLKNIVIGDIQSAPLVFTAHYDTCAVLPFPNFVTPKNMMVYVLYQLLLAAFMILPATAMQAVLLIKGYFLLANISFMILLLAAAYLLLAGFANKHTMNDNTSGVITVLEIALSLPEEQRKQAAFVLFDLEEMGMIGSAAFAKKHKKELGGKTVINFDCVSDGDSIHFCLTKKLKKTGGIFEQLEHAFLPLPGKSVTVERGFFFYPSDQMMFKRGIGVCALKQSRWFGGYIDRIHTARDTVFQRENIGLLRDGALRLIEQSRSAANKNSG